MNESPTATCCVCFNSSHRFHENISLLQAANSDRKISSILKLILGDESDSKWSAPNPICFDCVGKVNDYVEAFEKVQLIERELKQIHQNKNINFEDKTVPIAVIPVDDRFNYDDFDDNNAADSESDDSSNEPKFNEVQLEQSVEFEAASVIEESNVEQKSNDVPVFEKFSGETRKSEFYCEECGKNLNTSKGLTIHMTTKHKEAVGFECSVCHKSFPNRHLLEKHTGIDRCKRTEFYCEECGKNIPSYNGLMIHMAKKHKGATGLECMVCHKFFPNKHLLEKHTAVANCKRMDFKCKICQRSFMLAQTLKMHMKKQHESAEMEPPYDCDYCGVEFDDFKTLFEHKELHSNRPEFQCIECDLVLKRKTAYKLHMRTHSKQHQNLCHICAKAFSHPSSLNSHLKFHYNDMHMECYLCKNRTVSAEKLRRHMRKHTGEKPYECSECGKHFAQLQGRNRHFQLHFGPAKKPHKCTITMCDAAFTRAVKLSKHYMTSHGLDIVINPASNRVEKVNKF